MELAPGIGDVPARARLAMVLRRLHQKRKERLALARVDDGGSSDEEHARRVRRRKRRRDRALAAMNHPIAVRDVRDADEIEEQERQSVLVRVQAKKLRRILPGIGRGNSVANEEASRKRRTPVHPYPGGIYTHFAQLPVVGEADGFRQMTGFSKSEFDQFYDETHWAEVPTEGEETLVLKRPWFFKQARNNLGEHSVEENKERRTIKGLLDDRDRVLCWLQMLRKDTQFGDMSSMYGPSKGTFHNDFKDMTAAAQDMPCLRGEIQWPDAVERKVHADFLIKWGHANFPRVAYIVDGTKVTMRNPSKVGKGREEPHGPVHEAHHSRNKGLGYSHIVYVNVRGKILRVETVKGSSSDRGAHVASKVFLEPESFLSQDETGMGDGNYLGRARSDDPNLMMCVPHPKTANSVLSHDAKLFNSEQRRYRVVVENTIGQTKKWKAIGGKAFRHQRDFENEVFEVSARLTARIMRVRNQYPRSVEWTVAVKEGWEAKLGIHLWVDPEDPGSYLVHNVGEDFMYGSAPEGTAANLQECWEQIWDLTGV